MNSSKRTVYRLFEIPAFVKSLTVYTPPSMLLSKFSVPDSSFTLRCEGDRRNPNNRDLVSDVEFRVIVGILEEVR